MPRMSKAEWLASKKASLLEDFGDLVDQLVDLSSEVPPSRLEVYETLIRVAIAKDKVAMTDKEAVDQWFIDLYDALREKKVPRKVYYPIKLHVDLVKSTFKQGKYTLLRYMGALCPADDASFVADSDEVDDAPLPAMLDGFANSIVRSLAAITARGGSLTRAYAIMTQSDFAARLAKLMANPDVCKAVQAEWRALTSTDSPTS